MNIWLAAARTLQRDEYLAKEHLKPLIPTKFCVHSHNSGSVVWWCRNKLGLLGSALGLKSDLLLTPSWPDQRWHHRSPGACAPCHVAAG